MLRNFLRNKDNLQKQLNENESAKYSYPKWWIEKVKNQYFKNWKRAKIYMLTIITYYNLDQQKKQYK